MYYHPHMYDWAKSERTLAVCQAFVVTWLDSVARQQQAQAEAVGIFCARRVEGLQEVVEARNPAQFAARLLFCAAPEPHGWAELSARLAAISVDTGRKLGELVASHGDEMTRSVMEPGAIPEPRKKAALGSRAVERSRIAAWRRK